MRLAAFTGLSVAFLATLLLVSSNPLCKKRDPLMKYSVPMAALLVLVLAQNAQAQSPERIAHRCVEHVNQIVERCTNAAADETHECIRRINELLEAGRYEAAREVAQQCIRSATARTEDCVRAVRQACERCINVLLDMGQPELARRVHNACEDAVEVLRHLLQRETNAIQNALEG